MSKTSSVKRASTVKCHCRSMSVHTRYLAVICASIVIVLTTATWTRPNHSGEREPSRFLLLANLVGFGFKGHLPTVMDFRQSRSQFPLDVGIPGWPRNGYIRKRFHRREGSWSPGERDRCGLHRAKERVVHPTSFQLPP